MVIEGFGSTAGSGSIPLTSGSESWRPKNTWIRWIRIRIRIRNTGVYSLYTPGSCLMWRCGCWWTWPTRSCCSSRRSCRRTRKLATTIYRSRFSFQTYFVFISGQLCGFQCRVSGMFIPYPDFWPSRIPNIGPRIQKQQQKRGVKRNCVV